MHISSDKVIPSLCLLTSPHPLSLGFFFCFVNFQISHPLKDLEEIDNFLIVLGSHYLAKIPSEALDPEIVKKGQVCLVSNQSLSRN